jgi:hypothetical protein
LGFFDTTAMDNEKTTNQVCVKCGRVRQVDPEQRIIRCPYCRYEFNQKAEAAFLLEEEIYDLESVVIFDDRYKNRLFFGFIILFFLILWFGIKAFYWGILPFLAVFVHAGMKLRRFYFSERLKKLRNNLEQLHKENK